MNKEIGFLQDKWIDLEDISLVLSGLISRLDDNPQTDIESDLRIILTAVNATQISIEKHWMRLKKNEL
jgi:hypothetical protein